MSLRSIGALAQQRRSPSAGAAGADAGAAAALAQGAAAPSASFMKSLEAAIPTEVVALYTAIIAGCQSILNKDAHTTYLAFRLIIYLVALLCTVFIAFGTVHPAAKKTAKGNGIMGTALSPELLTATLAFAAWGLLLPGSFLYVWLSSPLLSIVVITVTAVTAFLLGVLFAPWLRKPDKNYAASGQSSELAPMTLTVPTKGQHGTQPSAPEPAPANPGANK